jgi:SRSO17 transposase
VRHQQFRSKHELAGVLVAPAIQQGFPFRTMLIDSWYLSSDLTQQLRHAQKDGVSLLKRNRHLETHSF